MSRPVLARPCVAWYLNRVSVGRMLIVAGAVLIVLGLLWSVGDKLGLGRLPGDLSWQRKGWSIHFPLMTSILLSVLLTLVINLFRK